MTYLRTVAGIPLFGAIPVGMILYLIFTLGLIIIEMEGIYWQIGAGILAIVGFILILPLVPRYLDWVMRNTFEYDL